MFHTQQNLLVALSLLGNFPLLILLLCKLNLSPGSAFAQFTKVCDADLGLCFNQVSDALTKTTIGISVPAGSLLTEDFTVRIITPLPYGYAGFAIAFGEAANDNTNSSLSSLPATVIPIAAFIVGPIGTFEMGMLAQQTSLSPDASQLIPLTTSSPSGKITFSPLSTWNSTSANFIFRCQNCPLSTVAITSANQTPQSLFVFRADTPTRPTPQSLFGIRGPSDDPVGVTGWSPTGQVTGATLATAGGVMTVYTGLDLAA
ncbi:hypothetical protein C8F01DRAFT_1094404 [Mycena amicta]|nr:hypothetical protein C8F01DRAFT_1094404 [Mycena amicta]